MIRYYLAHPGQAPAALRDRLRAVAGMKAKLAARWAPPLSPPVNDRFNLDTVGLPQNEESVGMCKGATNWLIEGTNDVSAGLAEMREDLGAYYRLSYSPKNQDYDGRFRTITVKVKRPHGRLQARKGYLAVKILLTCLIYASHSPLAKWFQDFIVPKRRTYQIVLLHG